MVVRFCYALCRTKLAYGGTRSSSYNGRYARARKVVPPHATSVQQKRSAMYHTPAQYRTAHRKSVAPSATPVRLRYASTVTVLSPGIGSGPADVKYARDAHLVVMAQVRTLAAFAH
eukprot:2116648-Rhodomonas_salina.2